MRTTGSEGEPDSLLSGASLTAKTTTRIEKTRLKSINITSAPHKLKGANDVSGSTTPSVPLDTANSDAIYVKNRLPKTISPLSLWLGTMKASTSMDKQRPKMTMFSQVSQREPKRLFLLNKVSKWSLRNSD